LPNEESGTGCLSGSLYRFSYIFIFKQLHTKTSYNFVVSPKSIIFAEKYTIYLLNQLLAHDARLQDDTFPQPMPIYVFL